jgi:Predicted hydrolase (metallo-beta-lactamase superfamily)
MSYLFMPLMKLIFIFFFVVVFILRIPFLVEWVKFFVSTISNFNYYYFNINIPSFSQILIIFYYVFLIMLFYFLEINFKKISKTILGVAITSFAIYIFPISNFFTFEVDFINVGQGDSTLIRYKNSCVMIDTGGILNYDLATNSLVPFLRKNRIYYIDSLILTHDDYDHIGAYESLKSSFYIKNVYRNKKDFPLNFENFIISNLNIYKSSLDDSNYNSLVLSLSIKNKTFLFMGDAPTEIENKIIRDNHDLRCDYLKVGHHGSNTSTSKNLVSLISPKEAIISCGKDNNYGHPHKETLAILNYYNVKIRRTDLEGTIRYKFII